ATIAADATALAVNDEADDHALYLAGPDGVIARIATSLLDLRRTDKSQAEPAPVEVARLPGTGTVTALAIREGILIALMDDDTLASVDLTTGEVAGTGSVPGAVAIAALPSTTRVVAHPDEISDTSAVAIVLADAL